MDTFKEITVYAKSKFNDPRVQKHSANVSWMLVAKVGTLCISFVSTAIIARHLGPQNYGQLSYSISFVSLFSFIASLGIEQILHRDLIRYPDQKNRYLGTAVGIRLIASTICVFVTTISALFFSSQDVSSLLIFILSLGGVFASLQLLSYEFQAESKSKYPSLLSLSVVLILNILKIIVVASDKGVIYLALVVLLEPVLYSAGYAYLKSKHYRDFSAMKFDISIARKLLKDSFPLIFASAFYLLYARIDQVMLKNMIDAKASGLYDAAVRISELSYFLPQTLLLALFPAIVNAKKEKELLYIKRLQKLVVTILVLSVSISIALTILAKPLLLIIFGEQFMGALAALYICAWSTIGASLNSLAQQILVTEDLTNRITVVTFLGMATNISLNMVFIPVYGIAGAAFATLVSYMVPFLSLLLFARTRKILLQILNISNS